VAGLLSQPIEGAQTQGFGYAYIYIYIYMYIYIYIHKYIVIYQVEGVAGLLSQPIEGAQTQGFRGLVKGAGKGLVGLALKPTAGMLDFAQRTMEGFANTFDYIEDSRSHHARPEFDPHERLRPPRMLHGHVRDILSLDMLILETC